MIVGAADPAVALSPLAYMAGLHTVAEYGPAFDGGHKVVKAGLAKIAVKAASARNSPLDADDSGFFQLFCDLVGKMPRKILLFCQPLYRNNRLSGQRTKDS